MRPTTLCLIINDKNQILLSRKKRGFGEGKYNGFGGKPPVNRHILLVHLADQGFIPFPQ